MKNKNLKYQKGSSVIEIILAISIFVLLLSVFVSAFLFGQESSLLSGKRNRGLFLAEEGLEATRNIRDESFSNLSEGIHGLAISNNQWVFSGSQDITDIFTRSIDISSIDSNTKQVISNVIWQQTPQRSATISLLTYFTNWDSESEIKDWIAPKKEVDLVEEEIIDISSKDILGGYCLFKESNVRIILNSNLKICLLREILEKHFDLEDFSREYLSVKLFFVIILIILLLILIHLL